MRKDPLGAHWACLAAAEGKGAVGGRASDVCGERWRVTCVELESRMHSVLVCGSACRCSSSAGDGSDGVSVVYDEDSQREHRWPWELVGKRS